MIATGTSNRGTSPHRPTSGSTHTAFFQDHFRNQVFVDGRDSPAWVAGRPRPSVAGPDRGGRDRPRRRLSQTITVALPNGAISVDPFHLVQQANLMVASVRNNDLDVRHRHRDRRHKGAVRHSSAIVGCCYPRLTVGQTVGQPTRTVADISDPAEVGAADSIDIGQAG